MLMCSKLEINGSVTGIYLYSSYMAAPPDPGHCTSLRQAPASGGGSQQMTLLWIWRTVQCNTSTTVGLYFVLLTHEMVQKRIFTIEGQPQSKNQV